MKSRSFLLSLLLFVLYFSPHQVSGKDHHDHNKGQTDLLTSKPDAFCKYCWTDIIGGSDRYCGCSGGTGTCGANCGTHNKKTFTCTCNYVVSGSESKLREACQTDCGHSPKEFKCKGLNCDCTCGVSAIFEYKQVFSFMTVSILSLIALW